MGGHFFTSQKARNAELREILDGESKYIVKLTGTPNTNANFIETENRLINHYRSYNELNETEIREHAKATSEFYDVKLSKIEIFSVEAKPLKELNP